MVVNFYGFDFEDYKILLLKLKILNSDIQYVILKF